MTRKLFRFTKPYRYMLSFLPFNVLRRRDLPQHGCDCGGGHGDAEGGMRAAQSRREFIGTPIVLLAGP